VSMQVLILCGSASDLEVVGGVARPPYERSIDALLAGAAGANRRIRATMAVTWLLCARPLPVTAALTSAAE